ncbi:MAG: hypothetical protein IH945_09465 [Armatimonadetes bacterium]|nr:hypothetical protein [Armatimonadota bacterium]
MSETHNAHPTGAEVKTFVTGAGVTVPSAFSFDEHAFAVIEEWQRLTRYRPFLAGDEAVYKYDPPGPNRTVEQRGGARRLFLDRGFVSVSEVRSAVTKADAVGTLLVEDDDYRLWPVNAAVDLEPYTIIDFIGVRTGVPNSISVKGVPGYALLLTADVYQAELELAAGNAMAALQTGLAGDTIDWTEGDVRERSSVELIQKWGGHWRKSGRATAISYRRAT